MQKPFLTNEGQLASELWIPWPTLPPPGPSLPPGDVLMPLLRKADPPPPDVQGVTQRKLWGGVLPPADSEAAPPPLLKSWKLP